MAASSPAGPPTAYYRLRQVDQDGTATYSPVRTVSASKLSLTLYPNPAYHLVTITGAGAGQPVEVVDARGRVIVATQTDETGAARLMGLTPGLYLVRTGGVSSRLVVE